MTKRNHASDLDTSSLELSPGGSARRDAMLGQLTQSMEMLHHRRRRRRRSAQTVGVVAVLVTCAWVVTLQLGSPDASSTNRIADNGASNVDLIDPPPNMESRLVIRPAERTGLIQVIDDAALVTLLASIDRPSGIVRSGGRTWLTAAVTDAELEAAVDEMATPDDSPTM